MNDKELKEEEVRRPSVKIATNRDEIIRVEYELEEFMVSQFENPQLHTGNARQTASTASTSSSSFQTKEKQQFKNVQPHESKRSPRSKPQSRENQESQKFKSKTEAIDHGTPYEEMMVVWQILSLLGDQRVANFKISSNHPQFGSFDDMVVKIEYKNGQPAYNAYQLKHSDNEKKTIKKESLRSLKGDFSIGKYYEQNHKINEKFIFILHTNRPFELINHTFNVQYDTDKTIDVQVVEKEHKSYIFEVLGNQSDEASFKSFFKRFRLDANQGGFRQLEARCLQEFSKLFVAKKEDFIVFKEFVHKWYLEKGKKAFLQKKFIITKIVECLLTPNLTYISYDGVDNKTKHLVLLKEAISKSNVTIFRSRHVWEKVKWTNSSSIDDINKKGFENFLIDKKCKSINDLTAEAYTKISWYQGQCPLIINVTEINLEIVKVSLELLSKNGIIDKKILLTCEIDATIEKYDNMISFYNLHDLKTFDDEIYQNIVENFDCTFQGKETKLSDLVDDDSAKIFTTDCLLRSAEGNLIIGGNKETVPENLMERQLQRIIIEPEITNETTNDLIVISYNDNKQNPEQVIFAKGSRNKHHLKCLDGSLEWIKSVGSTEMLRSYRNESLVYLDDELSCLKNSQHNLNVISAATGLGKSTMLKCFKNEYKVGFWVFFIDTKQQTKSLQQNLDVKTFVFSLFPMETLEKQLLEVLYNKRKLVFLWDALDEIPNKTQRELTLSFIENVQQLGFLQWISSRQHLQHELEEKFNTFGRNIQIFDEQQRDDYIKKRLSPKYNDEEITVLTEKIKQNMIRLEAHAILGMPLQLFLLTELVLRTEDLLLRPITLTKLFESLIEGKLNHYFSKSKNESELVKSQFKARYLDKYQTTAFQLICLEANVLRLEFNPYEKKLLDEVHGDPSDPVGLLNKSGKTMSFLHHTYAEYFAALYISENHQRIEGLKEFFSDSHFKNVKYMLDSILSKEFEAHTAVLYNDVNTLQNLGEKMYEVDKNGRSPLHIALSWTSQSFALPKLDPVKTSQLVRNWNNLEIAIFLIEKYISSGKESLLSDRDEILEQNCFDYAKGCLPLLAILTKNIRVIEFILKEETRLSCNQNEDAVLMYAAFTSNDDIIEYLVNRGIDFNMSNVNGNTVLHFLLQREGSYKLVELLVDRGADVNKEDKLGYRPLHYAATYGDLEVAKFIIERNVDINCRSQSNWTPLMIATSRGNLKMVELLIDKGADAEVKNDKGETATEIANKMRRYDIGQLLQATGKKNNILSSTKQIDDHLHYKDATRSIPASMRTRQVSSNESQVTRIYFVNI